jgi:hypothetical protein
LGSDRPNVWEEIGDVLVIMASAVSTGALPLALIRQGLPSQMMLAPSTRPHVYCHVLPPELT